MKQFYILLFFIFFISTSYSQQQIWKTVDNSIIQTGKQKALDSLGNIYVLFNNYLKKLNQLDGSTIWSINLTGDSIVTASEMLVDSMGNIFITGYQTNKSSNKDIVTLKYNTQGQRLWYVVTNGTLNLNDFANAIDKDKNWNIYICGSTNDNNLSDTRYTEYKNYSDAIIIKYDSSGNMLWKKSLNGALSRKDIGRDIAVTDIGEAFIVGSIQDYYELDIDHYVYMNQAFVAKYDVNGNKLWIKKSVPWSIDFNINYNEDIAYGVKIKNSNVYVLSDLFNGYLDYNNCSFLDHWSCKVVNRYYPKIDIYNLNGDIIKSNSFSSYIYDSPTGEYGINGTILSFKIDVDGNYFISKRYEYGIELIKTSINGQKIFNKTYEWYIHDYVYISFEVYLNQCFVIMGRYLSSAGQVGTQDLLVKFDSLGNIIWSKNYIFSRLVDEDLGDIITDKNGDVYFSGEFDDIYKYCGKIPTVNVGNNVSICKGDTVQLNGTSNGNTFSWSPINNIINETAYTPKVFPITTTAYKLTAMWPNKCSNNANVSVTVNPLPLTEAGSNDTICNGGSIKLVASGGDTFKWNNGDTSTLITVSPSSTTQYIISATNKYGCKNKDSVSVVIDSVLIANAGNDVEICYGTNTTLKAHGGSSYKWSPAVNISDTTIANPIVQPTVTTTYIVTVSDGVCSATDDVIVIVNNLPIASAGENKQMCYGKTTALTASGANSYKWSTNAITATISVTPTVTTTYTVTATDLKGCTDSSKVVITINPLPVADAGLNKSICKGKSTTIIATGGGNYKWNIGDTVASINVTPMASVYYTVTVTNSNGCIKSDNIYITVNSIPTANAVADQLICQGIQKTLTASGGSTYKWSTAAITASIIVSPFETTTYTVTVSNTLGCTSTDEVVVNVLDSNSYYCDSSFCLLNKYKVSGTVFKDVDSNCVKGVNDIGISNQIIKFTPGPYYAYTDYMGNFSTYLPKESYTAKLQASKYFHQICPVTPSDYSFVINSQTTSISIINFGVKQDSINDVAVTIGMGHTRIGQECFFRIFYTNKGRCSTNGAINFILPSELIFKYCIPFESQINNDTIVYFYNNLLPGVTRYFTVYTNIPNDLSFIGKNAVGYTYITTVFDDIDLENNFFRIEQPYRLSCDPNEKIEYPIIKSNEFINIEDSVLTYAIHFQNTGNDTAYKIVITDTLSPNVDVTSVVSGASSHDYLFDINGTGILKWTFNNIMLPDSAIDFQGSQGFVYFNVQLKKDILVGAEVSNKADIYFDFNPAVTTNTVKNIYVSDVITTVKDNQLSTPTLEVSPNPFSDYTVFIINGKKTTELFNITLYDIIGRNVKNIENINSNSFKISKDNLSPGVYYYNLRSNRNTIFTGKLIVQ